MLFNTIDFAVFLPIVFLLYWFVFQRNLKGQNLLIVVSSYIFYGWWDWRFLFLIAISTVIDYYVGLRLKQQDSESDRKKLVALSLVSNLGLLGLFKYFNFFIDNFVSAFSLFGITLSENNLNIILPVGISFYTFQTLSYTIDVYRKKLEPTQDFISFAAFVSFFPQLVAGPIERATHLLPQFRRKRFFHYSKAVDGLRQILWGLFKKVVIADNCAAAVNGIFANSDELSGSTLVLGAIYFAFQIYGDFSGYSDIAIGTSRLFGFDLKQNFAFPYFSRDIAEFWRRWHISLSTWFRDYLYIPLGGSKGSNRATIRNVFVIFVVSGFWHGANWTFVIWGLLNAIYFMPLLVLNKNRIHTDIVAQGKSLPNVKEIFQMLITFGLTAIAWIIFRAENIEHAFNYLSRIFSDSLFSMPGYKKPFLFVMIIVLLFIEWWGRESKHALERIGLNWKPVFRIFFYLIITYTILLFSGEQENFIYFQF